MTTMQTTTRDKLMMPTSTLVERNALLAVFEAEIVNRTVAEFEQRAQKLGTGPYSAGIQHLVGKWGNEVRNAA